LSSLDVGVFNRVFNCENAHQGAKWGFKRSC
jgi:hypothetical protein